MSSKIMTADDLDNIVFRLSCCHSLLCVLTEEPGCSVDALSAAADLLNSILRDFEENIAGAEDFQSGGGTA